MRLKHADEGQRARFASQLSAGLRSGGKWRQFECPSGPLFLGPDKNMRRIREESMAKRITRQLPNNGQRIGLDKRHKDYITVLVKGEALVQVSAPFKDLDVDFAWDNNLAKTLGFNPVELARLHVIHE